MQFYLLVLVQFLMLLEQNVGSAINCLRHQREHQEFSGFLFLFCCCLVPIFSSVTKWKICYALQDMAGTASSAVNKCFLCEILYYSQQAVTLKSQQ